MHKLGTGIITSTQDVDRLEFDWGKIHFLSEPAVTGAVRFSFGIVELATGKGHERHNHPGAEEIIYVISGEGEQMVDDRPPVKVGPGASIYIPADVYHSTLNTGTETMTLAVVARYPAVRLFQVSPTCPRGIRGIVMSHKSAFYRAPSIRGTRIGTWASRPCTDPRKQCKPRTVPLPCWTPETFESSKLKNGKRVRNPFHWRDRDRGSPSFSAALPTFAVAHRNPLTIRVPILSPIKLGEIAWQRKEFQSLFNGRLTF